MATSTARAVLTLLLANFLLASHVLLFAEGGPAPAPAPSSPPPPPPADIKTPFSFNITKFTPSSPLITQGITFTKGNKLFLTDRNYVDYYESNHGEALYNRPIVLLRTKKNKCQSASLDMSFSFRVSATSGYDPHSGFSVLFLGNNIDISYDYSYGIFGFDYNYYPSKVGSTAVTYESAPIYTDVPQVAFREPFTEKFFKPEKTTILSTYGKFHTSWISYDGNTAQWKVYLSPNSTKPKSPLAVRTRSLCSIIRPFSCGTPCKKTKSVYIGFGGQSGSYTSHEIGKWSFKSKFPA